MLILKVVQRIKTKSIEIEIDRNRMEGRFEKRKKGLHGNRTRDLSHPKRLTNTMSDSPILFEEIFEVRSVNPDGKAFEKGTFTILP